MTFTHGWIESKAGDRFHYVNGKLHNDDGPAVIHAGGTKYWYKHGLRHRGDGPAVIYTNGSEFWYKHGQLHRGDGPAVSLFLDDVYVWYYEDQIIGTSNKGYTQKKFEQWRKFKCFL